MKYDIIFRLLKEVYSTILRDLLIKAIDDPKEEWDEWVLGVCDLLFDYESTNK